MKNREEDNNESNSTRTIWLLDETIVVVLNRPIKPPSALSEISNPKGTKKKARS
jgi:hypothetical protein